MRQASAPCVANSSPNALVNTLLCIVRLSPTESLHVDELIRQVAINCAERGLLLLRVRDELQMTLRAYQTLYESSVAFGMRKALMAEQGKSELKGKVGRPRCHRCSAHRLVLAGSTGRGQT